MKAKAKVQIESPMGGFIFNSDVNIKKPDSLIVNLKLGFGIRVGSLFIDKKRFLLYNSYENILYYGKPENVNLSQLLQADLKIDDIVQAFSGIHLIKLFANDSLSIDKNKYLITSSNKNNTLKFWVDPKKYVVTESQLLDAEGKIIVKYEYKQFLKKNKIYLPKVIRIYQPGQQTRLTIFYSAQNPNYKMENKDFSFKIPEKVKKIKL